MKHLAILLMLTVLSLPAAAQGTATSTLPSDSDSGRFTMSPVTDGVMRLDGRTGQVSLCRKHNDLWACEMLADDRAAYEKEIGRLQDKVTKLEAALGRAPDAKGSLKLPDDAEVERVMKFFENILRRFKSMIDNLQHKNGATSL